MSIGRVLTGPIALLILLCFFLPWITVSCNSQPVAQFSGYELAAGGEINTGFGAQPVEGDPAVFVAPGAALLSLGLLLGLTAARLPKVVAGIGQLLGSIAGLAILLIKWNQLNENAAANGFEVSGEFGLWAAGFGLIVLVIGAVLILAEKPPRSYDSYDSWNSTHSSSW